MKLFRLACSHEFYLQDIHRFNDETVVGLCLKCDGVFRAAYGLALPGQLVGYRKKPCAVCDGTGKVNDEQPSKPGEKQ